MDTKDPDEIAKFKEFLGLVAQPEKASANRVEAAVKLYPDVYPQNEPHNAETCRDPACDRFPF